jgi:hypothetical protein
MYNSQLSYFFCNSTKHAFAVVQWGRKSLVILRDFLMKSERAGIHLQHRVNPTPVFRPKSKGGVGW